MHASLLVSLPSYGWPSFGCFNGRIVPNQSHQKAVSNQPCHPVESTHLPPSLRCCLPRGNDDRTKGEKRISRQSRSTRPTDNGRRRRRRRRAAQRTEGGERPPLHCAKRLPPSRAATPFSSVGRRVARWVARFGRRRFRNAHVGLGRVPRSLELIFPME